MDRISIEKTKKRKINNLLTESLNLGWKLEISKQSELYAIPKIHDWDTMENKCTHCNAIVELILQDEKEE